MADLPVAVAARVRAVLMDIDDTLTDGGKLGADAYAALWRLRRAGLLVVPVTGRPAGWCDLIARQWPVDAVIGENGALAFFEVAGRLERLFHPDVADRGVDLREQIEHVRDAVLAEVPGSRVAKDQPYRLFDLAIDFGEEPPVLGLDAAVAIQRVFERFGAHAKVSSIHVNGWFGDYDKLAMATLLFAERWGIDIAAERDRVLFCGDSPNDEPMFAFFEHSCAVANIARFSHLLRSWPAFVASQSGGAGFAEIVDVLLDRRL